VEIPGQSLPHLRGEHPCSAQALRVSHGYRAFSREILEKLHLADNSDDFVFDNQMLAQILESFHHRRGQLPDKSICRSVLHQFARSIKYGFGV